MELNRGQKLQALVRLPWTVRTERNANEGYLVARVAELPSAIATAPDEKTLGVELWASLEATLDLMLEFGDAIPLPPGVTELPWERSHRFPPHTRLTGSVGGDAWEQTSLTPSSLLVAG